MTALNVAKPVELGLPAPVNLAFGAAFRRERYAIRGGRAGLLHQRRSTWTRTARTSAPAGSSVFPGFAPSDASRPAPDQLRDLCRRGDQPARHRCWPTSRPGSRTTATSATRLTGKVAVRFQPSRRVTFRAAASTGFRAPGLSQIAFSKVTTNVIAGEFIDVGVFPVDHPAAARARLEAAGGGDGVQPQRRRGGDARRTTSPSPPTTSTSQINNQILLGATFDDAATLGDPGAAGFGTIEGVQYFTNGLDTRTQGVDVTGEPSGAGRAERHARPHGLVQLHPEQDQQRRSAAAGAGGRGLHRAGAARLGDRDRHRGRAAGLARNAPGQLSRRPVQRAGAAVLLRRVLLGPAGLLRSLPGELWRQGPGGRRAGLPVQSDQARGRGRNLFDTYPDQPSSTVVVDTDGSTSKDFNDNFGTFPWAAPRRSGTTGGSSTPGRRFSSVR